MWNRWPVQVGCMKQGTQSWCSGTNLRDALGKEVGEGFRMLGRMCTHGWFILMCGKNHHNIVKYLASSQNKLINLFKRRKLSDTISGKMKKVKQTSLCVCFFFKEQQGVSVVVQWLGLGAFTAERPGSILGQRTKIPQATKCGFKK